MNKNKKTKVEVILIISLSISALLLILATIYMMVPKGPYFKRAYFDFWEIDYPSTEPLVAFADESSWFGEHFEYIVFPNNREVNSKVESFLNKTNHNISSVGTIDSFEVDSNEIFNIVLDDQDKAILENRIKNYDGFKYWTLSADDNHQMAIYLSKNEVLFIFKNN